MIDAICHYDPDNNRFVVAKTTLYHVGTTSAFNGKNTIDVAVSNTGDPTGAWTIYRMPAQNDGTDGTPDHHCLDADGVSPGPCFQDYPHIGADRNGIYITTNEYFAVRARLQRGADLRVLKAQLAAHPAAINVTLVENLVGRRLARIHRVARHLAGRPVLERAKRTEYLLSTIADVCPEAYCTAKRIGLWALDEYGVAGLRNPGARVDVPHDQQPDVRRSAEGEPEGGRHTARRVHQRHDHRDAVRAGCWQLLFDTPSLAHDEVESHPDANDNRMQQTWYANGMLWGSARPVRRQRRLKAGIVWFAVEPEDQRRRQGRRPGQEAATSRSPTTT